MPSRISPAAVALLASSISASALLLVVYLRLVRSSNNSKLPPKQLPPASAVSPETLLGDKEVDIQEEATKAIETEEAQVEVFEPEEESTSECEYQLEGADQREHKEVVDGKEDRKMAEIQCQQQQQSLEDGCCCDSGPEDQAEVPITVTTVDNATMAAPSLGSAGDGPSPAAAVAVLAVDAFENNNNNTKSLADKNATINGVQQQLDDEEEAETEVSEHVAERKSGGTVAGGDRVSHWLAKNERFSRGQRGSSNGEQPAVFCQQQQQQRCETASSDDSGRPSSVDNNIDSATTATTPAANAAGSFHGNGCAGKQQQESDNNLLALVDRSKVIRGVSPVPGDENDIIHQFLIPNKLGGSMVGTHGRNINYIRAKSGASVWISRNFFDKKTQVVNVRGPVECVKAALQVIKKRFPDLDVKPINTSVPLQRNPALQPTMCQLSLPVGALVDVNVCAMCRGTTLFLQQPTHPSFHHLEKMDFAIAKHYADQDSVPTLPRPVNPGAVCVAPFGNAWHRAIIADVFPEEDAVLMKYLDWGGYEKMPVGSLKQIRTEMMHLPFQAVEAHLAYVSPVLSTDEDPDGQLERLSRTLHERFLSVPGRRVKCQVVYFNDVGQPCVYLYTKDDAAAGDEPWRFLQEDLVQAGLVQWFQMPHLQPALPQG